ncbi:phage putative head morphogenesis protein, SPP1 gp7 family [Streptococcus pneumoniae]|nr:phage putative head morphogenesis protein, SPP1 gp7 family [Streptococcus pneumoniae]
MKDIKYYRTTTNNAQVLRLIDGVMQVFDIEKKWVNSVVEKDGINFEMQYHTQESFDLKNGSLHELYEKYRDTNTSDLERMKLFKEMLDLSNGLEIPKNIERVK